jgi:hypothetical protein
MRLPNLLTSWLAPQATTTRRDRANPRGARPRRGVRLGVEALESRVVPSVLPSPDPIDPTRGETNLLRVVQMMADKQNLNAQDNFPVPYTVVVSAGGAAPTVKNWKAGAPLRIDADRSLVTGQGGHDIQVEVNTDRYINSLGQNDWRLRLNVNRIGTAPFAQNLSVVISFPFAAFNTETLPGAPNLFMGFQTRLPGTPGTPSYVTGVDGGVAPATMQMVLTPNVLGGTTHEFKWDILTTGAANPITFVSGAFDGNPGSNAVLNALGWSAYVQDVPNQIGAEIKVAENAIGSPAVDSKMDLRWTASSRSLTAFTYLEAESAAAASSAAAADYATQVVADQMPTDMRFVLHQNEAAGTLTLNHTANAGITEMTFLKRRSDGLALTGVAADDTPGAEAVPTGVALTLGLRGYANLDVSANTLDLFLQNTQVGGFNNTAQFFEKYNLEYVALRVKNAPDLAINFDGAEKRFTHVVTHVGKVAPFTEMVLDDNGRIGAGNAPLNLELPEKYAAVPQWHLWSIVDDGTRGTAVARALNVTRVLGGPFSGSATFDHNAPEIMETVELQTVAAHPMQTYLRSGLLSAVQPPIPAGATSPDPYIEVTGHIEDVPTGRTWVQLDFPLTASWQSEEKIGMICMAGYIGTLNFAVILEDNPVNGSFDFRPEGSLRVIGLDGSGNPDFFTGSAAIVYDVTGFDENVIPWPENYSQNGFNSRHETFFPNTTRLKEARLRLDRVPSLFATWHDEDDHTYIDIDTDEAAGPYAYVGGFQLQISTMTTLAGTKLTCDNAKDFLPPAATDESEHYLFMVDVPGEQTLKFGLFGVNSFHFRTDDAGPKPSLFELSYELDPGRPLTAAFVQVLSRPASTGALGTFFGGDDVAGTLDISYVPSSLWLQSDLDPTLCTKGLFPIPGGAVNLEFNVGGTNLFIHARDLAPNFCLGFDVTGSVSTLTLQSTNLAGTQVVKTGLVEILFQNTNAGLDGGVLFGTPLQEARMRFDDVPSVAVNWSTAGPSPFFDVDTLAADDPATVGIREDILGGLRFKAGVTAGPTGLPTYAPLVGTENHFFRLIDNGPDKRFEGAIIALDRFNVTSVNAANQLKVLYNGNVNRDLTVQVKTANGKFFSGYNVDAGLLINALPQKFDLTAGLNGQLVTYQASSGIAQLRLGGPGVIGVIGGSADGTYDKVGSPSVVTFNVDLFGLPAKFGYTLNPAGGVTITTQTAAGAADDLDKAVVRVRDPNGLGGAGLLGDPPIRDVRLRLDGIPTTTATWSTTAAGAKIDVSTAASSGPFRYLGGAQVALSTEVGLPAFAAPAPGQAQKLTFTDVGGDSKKSVGVQVFGLDEFHFETTNSPRSLSLNYAADSARPLIVDVDAAFGNKFFADYDVDVILTVTDIPTTWNFSTDFATRLDVTSSGGSVNKIEAIGEIKTKSGADVHTTQLEARVVGLPGTVHFQLVPAAEGFAELTLSNPITQVLVELKSNTKIFGEDYKHIKVQVDAIPAKWKLNWGLTPNPHAELTADAPLGPVSVVLSKQVAASTPGQYTVFQSPGGKVQYSDFTREIDRRYFRQGQGNAADREATFMTRLDGLYNSTSQLDPGEDHFIMRKNDEGKTEFISVRGTGFQGLSASLAGSTLTASVTINFPGDHSFFVGLENYRPNAEDIAAGKVPEFLTVDIQNIPDKTAVSLGPNKAWVDFTNADGTEAQGIGRVLVYKGRLPGASDGQDALKVLVSDAPSFIHLDWDLSINGGIFLSTAKPFEVAVLTQNSSNRIVADFTFQNLSIDWGLETMVVEDEIQYDPITGEIPIAAWIVFKFVKAFVNIDASPGVDGFLQVYNFIGNAQPLEGGLAPASPNQYVPEFSLLADDMTGILSVEAGIKVYLVGFGIPTGQVPGVPLPYVDLEVGALSAVNFDWWDSGGGPFNFLGDPDYIDIDPWDVWPLAHSQSGHLYPFGPLPPMLAAFPAVTTTTGPVLTDDLLRPLWEEAARRWAAAGANPTQIRLALGTTPTVMDLPGLYLGATENGRVYIDRDAAGWGWFVDPTPWADEEFGIAGGPADGRMDLLTVLMHEMGRLMGFGVGDAAWHGVMAATLTPGSRLPAGAPSAPAENEEPVLLTRADVENAPTPPFMANGSAPPAWDITPETPTAAPLLTSGLVAWDDDARHVVDPPAATLRIPVDGRGLVRAPEQSPASLPVLFDRSRVAAVFADPLPDDLAEPAANAIWAGPVGPVAIFDLRPADPFLADELDPVWVG